MPPFLWQEVAAGAVVFIIIFFFNSFWARGLEIAKGCELQDPGPLLHCTAARRENGTALPEAPIWVCVAFDPAVPLLDIFPKEVPQGCAGRCTHEDAHPGSTGACRGREVNMARP